MRRGRLRGRKGRVELMGGGGGGGGGWGLGGIVEGGRSGAWWRFKGVGEVGDFGWRRGIPWKGEQSLAVRYILYLSIPSYHRCVGISLIEYSNPYLYICLSCPLKKSIKYIRNQPRCVSFRFVSFRFSFLPLPVDESHQSLWVGYTHTIPSHAHPTTIPIHIHIPVFLLLLYLIIHVDRTNKHQPREEKKGILFFSPLT